MGRVTEALRALCTTLNVPATGDNKAELIESIADNYTGGGGGGGMLVVTATVNYDTSAVTLGKTFAEISEALPNVIIAHDDEGDIYYYHLAEKGSNGKLYFRHTEVEDYVNQTIICVDSSGAVYTETLYPSEDAEE